MFEDTEISLRVVQDAYIRSLILMAIHGFECYPGMPEKNPLFPGSNPLFPGPKGERRNEEIINVVNKAIDHLRNFEKHPVREAILYNYRGCFHNGCGQFSEAVNDYIKALEILYSYRGVIDNADDHDQIELMQGFTDDVLDIANNWARTRLLYFGPDDALDGFKVTNESVAVTVRAASSFEDMLKSLWANRNISSLSVVNRDTFAYALINLVYIKLAKGDFSSAGQWVNRSYKNMPEFEDGMSQEKRQKARDNARRVRDKWTEVYFDVLESSCDFYKSRRTTLDGDKYISALEESAERFNYDHFGFSRDEMIIHCNIPLVKMMVSSRGGRKRLVKEFHNDIERNLRFGKDKESKEDVWKPRTILDEPVIFDFLCYLYAASESETGNPEDGYEKASKILEHNITRIQNGCDQTIKRFPAYFGKDKPNIYQDGFLLPVLLRGSLQMINVAHSPHPLLLKSAARKAFEEIYINVEDGEV